MAVQRYAARPGGRSLRVQNAVHEAVSILASEIGRDALTVPQVAQKAGVTPSTIYRRWGDLATLLSDVAQKNLRTECPLVPTGDIAVDLVAWAEMYQDEMDSAPGRALMRDVLSCWDGQKASCNLLSAVRPVIDAILSAANPPAPVSADDVMDAVVAPLLMRLIFFDAPVSPGLAGDAAKRLVAHLHPA